MNRFKVSSVAAPHEVPHIIAVTQPAPAIIDHCLQGIPVALEDERQFVPMAPLRPATHTPGESIADGYVTGSVEQAARLILKRPSFWAALRGRLCGEPAQPTASLRVLSAGDYFIAD